MVTVEQSLQIQKQLFEKLRLIRNHGEQEKYNTTILGVCGRLDEIQAAVLNEKLKIFLKENNKRVKIGLKLHKILSSCSLVLKKIQKFHIILFPF